MSTSMFVTLGCLSASGQGASPPPQARAAGFTNRTYGPRVAVGPRVADSWNWVNANPGGTTVTQNRDGSITLIKTGGNTYNADIQTATPGGWPDGGGKFQGQTFGGGGYFEAVLSWPNVDPGYYDNTGNGWPAWWSNDIEMQSGNPVTNWKGQQPPGCSPPPPPNPSYPSCAYNNWIETDIMEFFAPGDIGFTLHNWYGILPNDYHDGDPGFGHFQSASFDPSKPHKYGMLWRTATSNSKGGAVFYLDDAPIIPNGNSVVWNLYNANTPPPPVLGTTMGAVMDKRHLYLILGSGSKNPLTIYSVSVWQATTAHNAYCPVLSACKLPE